MSSRYPEACPGSHMRPTEPNTCPVCDFVWVNVKFKKVVPTHGLVTAAQQGPKPWNGTLRRD